VGAQLAELEIDLDLAAVEFAVGLGSAQLDVGLGTLLGLLGGDRGLAAGDLDQLVGLGRGEPARPTGQHP
jgi:hypothetical protein